MNPEITLLVHNIRSTHNVGAIFRTAEGFGIKKIILSGYTPYPELSLCSKAPACALVDGEIRADGQAGRRADLRHERHHAAPRAQGHRSLCDRRHGRVCEDGSGQTVQHDDTGRLPQGAPRGRDGERDGGSEKVASRARVENASGQRGGHPPRRRDNPQAVIQ